MRQDFARPRLVLITTPLADPAGAAAALRAALGAGDVASVIVDPAGRSEAEFQPFAEAAVAACREYEVAVMVAGDTRVAGRAKADGFHLVGDDLEALREAVERFAPRAMVGASGFTTRHEALEAGELLPDYILFGAFGADRAAGPRPEDLELAEWWAEIVEVPCIVLGGGDVETLGEAVRSGAEFVALSAAVFADPAPAAVAAKVERANRLIDEVSEGLTA
ncbi:thiamine phosphate synthase [Aureimonas endophytica]|uniref:Thiamine phosphate synthase n=1 Tax=Aureimonas endophytica TaxID=2027858 RepID=A0A916ZGD6_9HYPH|nr:thiamine phosphate synthase [Aureimonas endophytica]GGD95075.1 thiamine phosphate synthase [Aureimonas endophytica]